MFRKSCTLLLLGAFMLWSGGAYAQDKIKIVTRHCIHVEKQPNPADKHSYSVAITNNCGFPANIDMSYKSESRYVKSKLTNSYWHPQCSSTSGRANHPSAAGGPFAPGETRYLWMGGSIRNGFEYETCTTDARRNVTFMNDPCVPWSKKRQCPLGWPLLFRSKLQDW